MAAASLSEGILDDSDSLDGGVFDFPAVLARTFLLIQTRFLCCSQIREGT
jgi:hypothetical protein